MVSPTYKARLIFAARVPGLLNWETASRPWLLPTGHRAVLEARHVARLSEATEFHFDVGGFKTAQEAHAAGEQLRRTLRLVNAVLGLGLFVPTIAQEIPRAQLAPHLKEKVAAEYGAAIVDCVFGLNVLREGEEFELAVKADATAKPANSDYVLDVGFRLWGLDDQLDELSKASCELLNSASRDPSPRSAYLTVFLALDLLMERRERSQEAQQTLKDLAEVVETAVLDQREKQRLKSFLGNWRSTSLEAEIDRFASLGANASILIEGEPMHKFLKSCLKLRHQLAHPQQNGAASPISESELMQRRDGLRRVVLSIVWTRGNLPHLKYERPGDVVTLDEMKISVL